MRDESETGPPTGVLPGEPVNPKVMPGEAPGGAVGPAAGYAAPPLIDVTLLADRLDDIGRNRETAKTDKRAAALAVLREADLEGMAAAARRLETRVPGIVVARAICELRDAIVDMTYRFVRAYLVHPESGIEGEGLCVTAVGGYGRGLMAPYSDVDLLFLIPYKSTPWVESMVESVLYLLWDLGLKVGHATRSVNECLRLAKRDHTIATTLLETRLVSGDVRHLEDLRKRFAEQIAKTSGANYVEAKLAERDERHSRLGNSRYLVEPNVKEGKGGLRDLHTLFWIAKYIFRVEQVSELVDLNVLTQQEYNTFRSAESFLWDVRCRLHTIAGRAEERLSFDLQLEVAGRMGYADTAGRRGVEAFMKNYFLVAKDVGDLTRIICAALEMQNRASRPIASRLLPFGARLPGAPKGFSIVSGRLGVDTFDVFQSDSVNLIRLFHLATQNNLYIHPGALRLVTQSLSLVDDALRTDEEANRLFLEILTSRKGVERGLRRMNEAGVLGLFVPDFGRIVAMMQFNMYHHYTVDEHLLRVVGQVNEIERGSMVEELPLADRVMRRITARRVLYVAAFLHDIAKGRKEDHSIAGARVAEMLCPRFGLDRGETETVVWLVRWHLIMSDTAQRRDIFDPKTVRDFTAHVQSPERLRLLFILTIADIRGVGPGTWNSWKAQLLSDLYTESEIVLRGGDTKAGRRARVRAAQEEVAEHLTGWAPGDLARSFSQMTEGYWLAFDAPVLARHAALIRTVEDAVSPEALALDLEADEASGVTRVTVAARDRQGLFATLTGAIAAAGGTIVEAKVNTSLDGVALDVFDVQGPGGGPFDPDAEVPRLEGLLRACLAGETDPAQRITRKRPPKREQAFDVAPSVVFDNHASDAFTVVEAGGRDRPGLLFDLAQALRSLRLSVGSAHIATYGERAVDVFYVKDRGGLKLVSAGALKAVEIALLEVLQID